MIFGKNFSSDYIKETERRLAKLEGKLILFENLETEINKKAEEAKTVTISRPGKESPKEYTAYIVTLILKYLDVEYKEEACLVKRKKKEVK